MEKEKDKNMSLSNSGKSEKPVVLSLFQKDNFLVFLYKKSERVVSALYLVGNLLSDDEPVKWKFREIGTNILSKTLSLVTNPLRKKAVVLTVSAHLFEILSLLDVLRTAGSVSEMNHQILKREIENLVGVLCPMGFLDSDTVGDDFSIHENFFAIPADNFNVRISNAESVEHHSGGNRANFPSDKSFHTWDEIKDRDKETGYKGQDGIKDRIPTTRVGPGVTYKGRTSKGHSKSVSGEVNPREIVILKELESRNNLTIKDFSLIIKDCSTKTIQRELLRMVATGVLKKVGERRWSRYSLSGRVSV